MKTGFELSQDEIFELSMGNTKCATFDYWKQYVVLQSKKLITQHENTKIDHPLGHHLISILNLDIISLFEPVENDIHFASLQKFETEGAKNLSELRDIHHQMAEYSAKLVEDITKAHPYLELFPPLFEGDYEKGLDDYFSYVLLVQHEMAELSRWCLDVDFYPEQLSGLTPQQRLYLYAQSKGQAFPFQMKQVYDFREMEEVNWFIRNRDIGELELKHNAPIGMVRVLKKHRPKFPLCYLCESLRDMLLLEVLQMVHYNIRLKKCRHCGKYFSIRGKHNSDYCSRIIEGTNQTCQNFAASQTFRYKVVGSPAHSLYQKYYKRYHARNKVRTIKDEAFKKWKYEAMTKRDAVIEGSLPAEEFEVWLEESFPNRPKKK